MGAYPLPYFDSAHTAHASRFLAPILRITPQIFRPCGIALSIIFSENVSSKSLENAVGKTVIDFFGFYLCLS